MTRVLALLAGATAVTLLVGSGVGGALWAPDPYEAAIRLWALAWVGFPVVGTIIAVRQPRTRIAWLLIAMGGAVGLGQTGELLARASYHWGYEVPELLSYLGLYLHAFELSGFTLLALVLLHFPGDRLPTRAWRYPAWLLAVVAASLPVLRVLSAELEYYVGGGRYETVPNPLALPGVSTVADAMGWLWLIMFVVLGVALHFVVRGFRSRGVERQQMKWIAIPCGVFLVGIFAVNFGPGSGTSDLVPVALFIVCFNAMAAAMGVAVLRFRLYDVDRVASRTATYAVLTALLVGVYAAGVVLVGGALRPFLGDAGGDLVVAASTLAVAALFAPMRRRIQVATDRRFNRAQIDAARTVEEFARQLRDEVDLDALSVGLHEVVARAVQPERASVWLR